MHGFRSVLKASSSILAEMEMTAGCTFSTTPAKLTGRITAAAAGSAVTASLGHRAKLSGGERSQCRRKDDKAGDLWPGHRRQRRSRLSRNSGDTVPSFAPRSGWICSRARMRSPSDWRPGEPPARSSADIARARVWTPPRSTVEISSRRSMAYKFRTRAAWRDRWTSLHPIRWSRRACCARARQGSCA